MSVSNRSEKDPERTVWNSEDKFTSFWLRLRFDLDKNHLACPSRPSVKVTCSTPSGLTISATSRWRLRAAGWAASAVHALSSGTSGDTSDSHVYTPPVLLWGMVTAFCCTTGTAYAWGILLYLKGILFTISMKDGGVDNLQWMRSRLPWSLYPSERCLFSLLWTCIALCTSLWHSSNSDSIILFRYAIPFTPLKFQGFWGQKQCVTHICIIYTQL